MLQTDKDTEFLNVTFQKLLQDNNIHFYTAQNEDIKAAVVERFNRSLKKTDLPTYRIQDLMGEI